MIIIIIIILLIWVVVVVVVLSEVCKGVEIEPMLQPLTGETLKYQTAKTENNARLNVSALGFWCRDQRALFDIRVFDSVGPSHAQQSLDTAHSKQENKKRRQYEDRILHVEHTSFTPLVFTIAGGMSKCTKKFFSRLGEMLAEKRLQPKSIVFSWIRCRVSFSPAICGKTLTRYKIQKRNSLQHPTHRFTATGFYGTIKRSHIRELRFSHFCKTLE